MKALEPLKPLIPQRLASRILGMGDVIGLIERAEAAFDAEVRPGAGRKDDVRPIHPGRFCPAIEQVRKMGPLGQILEMLPGILDRWPSRYHPKNAEQQLKWTEAIINSMTRQERRHPDVLNASRRRRIARGSGTDVQDVNRVHKAVS